MQGREDPSTGRATSQSQNPWPSLPPPSSNMLAASRMPALPSPPHPDRPSSYTSDPAHYGRTFSPALPEHRLPPLAGSIERLPSVSQLLTPSSQAAPALGPSPFYERNAPLDRRIDLPSPHPQTPSEGNVRPSTSYFQQDAWRDPNRDTRPSLVPQPLAPAQDGPNRSYGPSTTGAPSPLQISSDSSAQHHGPLQPAVRTPTTWMASQSPQSAASTIHSTLNASTPVVKTLEKANSARKLLGERHIPGEGRVYVYDDGTKIPTSVDGEPVNGQWGMTKAGKPRKRMPQACIACRQKKIKCDPGENKCAQCEKSGKDCRYTEGQRGHKSSASSPSRHAGPDTPGSDRATSSPQFTDLGVAGRKRSASFEATRGKHKRIASADSAPTPKRQNFDQNWTAWISEDERGRLIPAHLRLREEYQARGPNSSADFWASGMTADGLTLDDPFLAEPESAGSYLQNFFDRINNGTYMILPRRTIEAWTQNTRVKTRGEITALYGMLACGCLFSDQENAKKDSERYVRAARYGIDSAPRRQGLLLVLSRFILGHYYFTLGDFGEVLENNDLSRAVAILPRSLEERLRQPDSDGCFDFGMNRHALGELTRRVQWLAFVVDRFIGITTNYPLCFNKKDQFVKLPCDNEAYDRGDDMRTPYFDNGILGRKYIEAQPGDTSLSIWAYFIQGISFDSDIRSEAQRSEWQDDDYYPGNYDAFAKRMSRDLDHWVQRLPANLHFTEANIDRHLHDNSLGIFFAIHALYHTCHINLNRRVRANLLPHSSLSYNARATNWHARILIERVDTVRRRIEAETARLGHEPVYQPSPYLGYAIHSAMDVMTCCGLADASPRSLQIMELCEAGLEGLSRVAVWYASSRGQLRKVEKRVEEIKGVMERARKEKGSGDTKPVAWVCVTPLQQQEPAYMDIYYQDHGGVRNVILTVAGIKAEGTNIEYLQKEKIPGLVDPSLKKEWGGT